MLAKTRNSGKCEGFFFSAISQSELDGDIKQQK